MYWCGVSVGCVLYIVVSVRVLYCDVSMLYVCIFVVVNGVCLCVFVSMRLFGGVSVV